MRSQSACHSGSACSLARASPSISPQSLTQRSRASRVLQKDRPCQPEFFLRGLPFLRCKIHCSGSSTTLHLSLSWAMRRLEECAGRSARSWCSRSVSDAGGRSRPSLRQSPLGGVASISSLSIAPRIRLLDGAEVPISPGAVTTVSGAVPGAVAILDLHPEFCNTKSLSV